jgi:tetratricopeptide (TPR) repeat protein
LTIDKEQLINAVASWYCKQGNNYYETGHYERAYKCFKQSIECKPDYVKSLFGLAITCYSLNKNIETINLLNKILELKPKSAEAYLLMSVVYFNLGRYHTAIGVLNKTIELNSLLPEAFLGLGTALMELQKYKEAINACNEIIKIDPDYRPAYTMLIRALKLLKRWEETIIPYKKIIKLETHNIDAHIGLGYVLKKSGRYNAAINAFKYAIKLDPNYVEGYLGLGSTYNAMKRYKEALAEFEKCLKIDPDNEKAYFFIGNTYCNSKRYIRAIHAYNKAIDLQREEKIGFLKSSIEASKKGVKIDLDSPHMQWAIGISNFFIGDLEIAIKAFKRYLSLNPNDFYAFTLLGASYSVIENSPKAIEAYETALKLKPNVADAHIQLGIHLFYCKKYNEAADNFQIAKDKATIMSDKCEAAFAEGLYQFVLGIIKWAEQNQEQSCGHFLKASNNLPQNRYKIFLFLSRFLINLIPIDAEIEKLLLSSSNIDDLRKGISKLHNNIEDLLNNSHKPELWYIFPPIEAKSYCLNALRIALSRKKYSADLIDQARAILREHGFLKGKKAVDAIENFTYDYIKLYEQKKGELSEQDELLLLEILKPATDLNGVLSQEVTVRQTQKMMQELVSLDRAMNAMTNKIARFDVKGQETFSRISEQVRRSLLFVQKEDFYEVYINGKRKEFTLSYVNRNLRKNKNKYDLWIDAEEGVVRVNKKPIKYTPNSYKLLVHIAKNVGKLCPRSEIFKAVWSVNRDNDDPDYTRNLQTMFTRHIHKYASGKLKGHIEAKRGVGYYIKETLNSCFISKCSKLSE